MPVPIPPLVAAAIRGGVPETLRQWGIPSLLAEAIGLVAPDPTMPYAFGRIGVLPGREKIASTVIKRGLKEPWFHGSPYSERLLEPLSQVAPGKLEYMRTFNPANIGGVHGLRLGEPAGVSLTRSPEVARSFGDVLRVGVDIPPSSVGQFVDPEMQSLLRTGFRQAEKLPLTGIPEEALTPLATSRLWNRSIETIGDLFEFQRTVGMPFSPPGVKDMAKFNQAMSEYLRSQGVEAIAYSPRRWAEYELRLLDPSKAVPLGRVPMDMPAWTKNVTPGSPLMERYLYGRPLPPPSMGGLTARLSEAYRASPEFPVRLRDVLGVGVAD